MLGEKVFYLTKLNLQGKMAVPLPLEPCCSTTVSAKQDRGHTTWDRKQDRTQDKEQETGHGTGYWK